MGLMSQTATIVTCMNNRVIGILRTKPGTTLKNAIQAIQIAFDSGIEAVEITANSYYWHDVVYFFSRRGLNIGVGSVKNEETALEAINCGANFFVSPGLFEDVLSVALRYKIKIIPGVYKEADLAKAKEAGVTFIKFFPASSTTHEELFKAIKEPFRDEFEELTGKGWMIDFFRDKDIRQTKSSIKYFVESPTEFYKLYLDVKHLPEHGQVFIKLPDGNLGFERLKSFSTYASKLGIKTYAVGGVNDNNICDVVTKYGAYGVCSGSSMFDAEAIFKGDFVKVKLDIERQKLLLVKAFAN